MLLLLIAVGPPLASAVSAGWLQAHSAERTGAVPILGLEELRKGAVIAGEWRFHPGDNPAWASPAQDDSGWEAARVPQRWPRGGYPEANQMAWYRLTLQFTPDVVASGDLDQLAVGIGKVFSAYELYAGGNLLGGVGSLPPLGQVVYDRERMYEIPESAVGTDGRLTLALRVWGGEPGLVNTWGGGPVAGGFRIGLQSRLLLTGILHEIPGLIFCVLSLAFGCHHLLLYARNRSLTVYLWFGLLAMDIAIYGLMLTQWKQILALPFLVLKKLEFGAIYIFPALAIQMLWTLIDRPISRAVRLYQRLFAAMALLVVVVPGLAIHYYTLTLWQASVVPFFFIAPWVLLQECRAGNSEARNILPAVVLFLGTCVNDLLIDLIGLDTVRLMPVGFLAILTAMSLSLVNRFTRMFSKLEAEVDQRTTELSELNRQLVEAARVDHLTGVLNRRGFTEEAEAEVARMQRTGVGFSIVLADVDFFKHFNDQHGHVCGDHVLRRVADILQKRTRDIDQIGRWGGEEFILLLPETDTGGGAVLAEKLRQAVEENVFEFQGERMTLTMTFGVAAFREGDTLDGCIARADTALYHGKKDGRNKVMIGKYKGLSLVN